jgi:hypothetical protein
MVLITGTMVNCAGTVVSDGNAVVNSCRIEVSSGIKVVKRVMVEQWQE